MALKESEIRVLAILGLIILTLWAFFGLIWSLLLVFTFLIYAYNFGRQQEKRNSLHEAEQDELDVPFQEKQHDYYSEFQDFQFTGLPKQQFTLRSPMPLLSEVTKRLTFNTSAITPYQAKKPWHNNRQLGNPYLSSGSPVTYWRKSNHFSLLNPALQRPSTVKIASPDATINRTYTLSNSPLKKATPEQVNPCSRATVLSALRESRKRSYVVDDEDDLELILRPAKRRGIKPVSNKTSDSNYEGPNLRSNRMFCGGLKRTAIQDNKETAAEENSNKRSKVTDGTVQSAQIVQDHKNSLLQKRRNVDTESATSKDDIEKSKAKKIKKSASTGNEDCHRPARVENEDTRMEDSTTVSNVAGDEEDIGISDKEHKVTLNKRSSSSQVEKIEACAKKPKGTSTDLESSDHGGKDDVIQQTDNKTVDTSQKNQKRCMVARFSSKVDSRRRTVPVYCASNEESEMPQRRKVSRKVNQKQITIDRKLAWERVQKFLDDDEDEEQEEDKKEEQSKTGTTAVSSTAETTCVPSSLFKIPAGHAVPNTGTRTTITTQSLVSPALSTGFPKTTTRNPLGNTRSQVSQTVQGNTAVTQHQTSEGSLLQSILKPGLVSNSITTETILSTASTKQHSLGTVVTCASKSNPSLGSLQAFTPLASTATSLNTSGSQIGSASSSSLGNFSFLKPTTTDRLGSLSDPLNKSTSTGSFQLSTSIAQSSVGSSVPSTQTSKVDFSLPAVSSSGASTIASVGGFNFSAPTVVPNAFSSDKTVVSQSNPGAANINSNNVFTLPSTSQTPVAFGATGNTSTPSTQKPFASFAKPSAAVSTSNSSGIFGQNSNTTPNSLSLTTQNKGTFGSTNMQSLSASAHQAHNASSGSFGASPFTQSTFGIQPSQNASQGAFGSSAIQNTFGTQQSQQASQITFGPKSAFTPEEVKSKNTFGLQAGQSTGQSVFGNQSVTQLPLGNQTAQTAFGTPHQPTTQNSFGAQASQNAFGAQLNHTTTQSAFGARAKQASKSTFNFAPSASQTATNSPFSSLGNKPSTQGAFGATLPPDAAGTPGGFKFGAAASTPTPGGFTFSAGSNTTGGFQFNGSGSSSSFSGFGQASAQAANPMAVPAPSASSGGFNFTPGSSGTVGSPFATPAPAFGAPGTPQGASSSLTAKARARSAARRRGKK